MSRIVRRDSPREPPVPSLGRDVPGSDTEIKQATAAVLEAIRPLNVHFALGVLTGAMITTVEKRLWRTQHASFIVGLNEVLRRHLNKESTDAT
jgi:hypothetical protein